MPAFSGSTLAVDGHVLLRDVPAGVSAAQGPDGIFLRFTFSEPAARQLALVGKPAGNRYTAAHRTEPFWMRPAVTFSAEKVPVETQVLFAELQDRRVALFVPLIDGSARCSLQGDLAGLAIVAETGNPGVLISEATALFIAVQQPGESVHTFLTRTAAAVANHLGVKLRHEKILPNFIDSFGWCTWDAFYADVSAEKVRAGLQSFRDAGIAPRFLILDDGWQSVADKGAERGGRLTALAANEKFAGDLSQVTRLAKQEFGIRHVIAWHAMQGYWSGVDPATLPQYAPQETPREFSPGILHHWPEANTKWWGHIAGIVAPEHIARFFNDYHALLKSQGVDGVKVDNQAALEALAHGTRLGRVGFTAAYREALEASAQKHFSSNLLNCMSCANDNLYFTGPSSLTRTSVDFWPAKPNTHGTHLWTNALVSLWFGHFIHPDWDMFQSALPEPHTPWSAFHAAARAISGGPVYVSDKPGQYNAELIRSLTFSDGTVPRCDRPAEIARDCLFRDLAKEPALLKITNTARNSTAGVVGLFNCHYDPAIPLDAPPDTAPRIEGIVAPQDLPELAGHDRYAIYYRGTALNAPPIPALVAGAADAFTIALGQAGWEIFTVVPIEDGLAIIGLIDKLIPAATVSDIAHYGRATRLHIKDAGTLGLWSERPITLEFRGQFLPIQQTGPWITAHIPAAGELLLK